MPEEWNRKEICADKPTHDRKRHLFDAGSSSLLRARGQTAQNPDARSPW